MLSQVFDQLQIRRRIIQERAQWLKSTLDGGNVFIGLPETCPVETDFWKDFRGKPDHLDDFKRVVRTH